MFEDDPQVTTPHVSMDLQPVVHLDDEDIH